jgi:two-component system nitrogen regulation response regulator GlnG
MHIEKEHDWEAALAKLVRRKLNMGQRRILDELARRFEATLLREALDQSGGHRQNAAKLLGWGRNTLTRKLKDLDIR